MLIKRLFEKWFKKQNKEIKAIKRDYSSIRMSIKSLVMFESLTGKNFGLSMEEEDITSLLYCIFVCSTGMEISQGAFEVLLQGDSVLRANLEKQLFRLEKFAAQFRQEEPKDTGEEEYDYSIAKMVDKLIFAFNLDLGYVMDKMSLWELKHLYEGADDYYKQKMEEQRLWTFLQVAPQIDLKKVKSPEQFLPFPWQEEDIKKNKVKDLEKEKDRALATIGMTIKLED